jgi:hypothetical protein
MAKLEGRGNFSVFHNNFTEGQAVIPDNLWNVPVALGYEIVMDQPSEKYFCLNTTT